MIEKELIDLNQLIRYGVIAQYLNRKIASTPIWRDCIVLGRSTRVNGNTLTGVFTEPLWEIIDEYGEPKEIHRFHDIRFIASASSTA